MLTRQDKADLVYEFKKVFVTREEFREELREVRNDMLSFKDEILGEIQSLRQEIQITIGYRGAIEDHEQRIQVLEKKQAAP